MKKFLIVIIIAVVAGVGYWLISPLFRDEVVNERIEDIMPTKSPGQTQQEPQIVSAGSFSGLEGHNAKGTATLLKIGGDYYVRFEDDFVVTNGPDLFVHFGKDGQYVSEARLGALKGNIGGQNYKVPAEFNPADFNEVWIWCRSFSVPFGKAQLKLLQ